MKDNNTPQDVEIYLESLLQEELSDSSISLWFAYDEIIICSTKQDKIITAKKDVVFSKKLVSKINNKIFKTRIGYVFVSVNLLNPKTELYTISYTKV